jgi:hypothetical protein
MVAGGTAAVLAKPSDGSVAARTSSGSSPTPLARPWRSCWTGGASARMIADHVGHSRVSMTQDVYLGRRVANAGNLAALESYGPSPTAAGTKGT